MTRAVLGIDTSCYTTSCALMGLDYHVLGDARQALQVALGQRGLRQSEAFFQHVQHMPRVLFEAIGQSQGIELVAICVSDKPDERLDSYMPVFHAGLSFAQALASAQNLALYQTTHQRGHLAAASLGLHLPARQYLAIHLSGGTTQVLLMDDDALSCLGGTTDISAGQLLDRLGVAMGLAFPAGPWLEKIARDHAPLGRYPVSQQGQSISLSGAEAAALRDLEQGQLTHGQIAAELFDVIARTVLRLCQWAVQDTGVNTLLLTGGVLSSSLLRSMLDQRREKRRMALQLIYGKPEYSGDNAVGIAAIGVQKYLQGEKTKWPSF